MPEVIRAVGVRRAFKALIGGATDEKTPSEGVGQALEDFAPIVPRPKPRMWAGKPVRVVRPGARGIRSPV